MFYYHDLLRCQCSFTRDWIETCVTAVSAYSAACDPRPDLAVPARVVQTPYRWWW